MIKILSQFEVESSENLMHMPSHDNMSFDDILIHLKDPRVSVVAVRNLRLRTRKLVYADMLFYGNLPLFLSIILRSPSASFSVKLLKNRFFGRMFSL